MTRHWVPILPEHVWSKVDPKKAASGKYTNNPPYVGSGPFKAMEWKKTSHVNSSPIPTRGGAPSPRSTSSTSRTYTNDDTHAAGPQVAATIDGGVDLIGRPR